MNNSASTTTAASINAESYGCIPPPKSDFAPLKPPGDPEQEPNAFNSNTEALLARALAELDRERTKRTTAETVIATLQLDQRRLRSDLITMRSQRDAFVDMVETMTAQSDAIVYATSRPQNESLPLHDIRLLEVMPWDIDRVKNIVEKVDEVHEWQVYNEESGRYTNHRDRFPVDFQSLSVYKPKPSGRRSTATSDGEDNGNDDQYERDTRTSKSSFKGCVLTDEKCTRILNLEEGYPLPSVGSTWRWVGGWRVELQHPCGTPCDENGWTYAMLPRSLLSKAPNAVFGSADAVAAAADDASSAWSGPLPFRRRRWTRLRVLVSYPSVSERTESCLYILAQNAMLELNGIKLVDQVLCMTDSLKESAEVNKQLRRRLRSAEAAMHDMEQDKQQGSMRGDVDLRSITPTTEVLSVGTNTSSSQYDIAVVGDITDARSTSPSPPLLPSRSFNKAPTIACIMPDSQKGCTLRRSQGSTYSTEASAIASEADDTPSASNGYTPNTAISMGAMRAKEIVAIACKKQVENSSCGQRAAFEARGAIDGQRLSLDGRGASAFIGRIVSSIPLRSRAPSELKDSMAQTENRSDVDEFGTGTDDEAFRISSAGWNRSRRPTVTY